VLGPTGHQEAVSEQKVDSLSLDSLFVDLGLVSLAEPRTIVDLSTKANLDEGSRCRSRIELARKESDCDDVLKRIDHIRGRGRALASRLRQVQQELEEEAYHPDADTETNGGTLEHSKHVGQADSAGRLQMPKAGATPHSMSRSGCRVGVNDGSRAGTTPSRSPVMDAYGMGRHGNRLGGSPSLSAMTRINTVSGTTMLASTIDRCAITSLPGAPPNSKEQNGLQQFQSRMVHENSAESQEAFLPSRRAPQLQ